MHLIKMWKICSPLLKFLATPPHLPFITLNYISMEEWNGMWEKNLVWKGKWNGKFLVWNGRNFAIWNIEKSSSIPFHSMPCPQVFASLIEILTAKSKYL